LAQKAFSRAFDIMTLAKDDVLADLSLYFPGYGASISYIGSGFKILVTLWPVSSDQVDAIENEAIETLFHGLNIKITRSQNTLHRYNEVIVEITP
jgi:hypothetical protein